MNKKLLLTLVLLFCLSAQSQVINWNLDVSAAIEMSNKQNKPLLLLFTDSKSDKTALNTQIFNTLDFAVWARDNVILVKVDLSSTSLNDFLDGNLSLQKAFGVEQLPTVCFARARLRKDKVNYELIGKTGFKAGGVKVWIEDAQAILRGPQEE